MTDFTKVIANHYDVESNGDNSITIAAPGGYSGEDVTLEFTIEELEYIIAEARTHHVEYAAYVANGYEDLPDKG
jgi:hypothetical protein